MKEGKVSILPKMVQMMNLKTETDDAGDEKKWSFLDVRNSFDSNSVISTQEAKRQSKFKQRSLSGASQQISLFLKQTRNHHKTLDLPRN